MNAKKIIPGGTAMLLSLALSNQGIAVTCPLDADIKSAYAKTSFGHPNGTLSFTDSQGTQWFESLGAPLYGNACTSGSTATPPVSLQLTNSVANPQGKMECDYTITCTPLLHPLGYICLFNSNKGIITPTI